MSNDTSSSFVVATRVWKQGESLGNAQGWTLKSVFAASMLHFISLTRDEQFAAYRQFVDDRDSASASPKASADRRITMYVDRPVWSRIDALSSLTLWSIRAIVATALISYCSADDDTQWRVYRQLAELRKGLFTLPDAASPAGSKKKRKKRQ